MDQLGIKYEFQVPIVTLKSALKLYILDFLLIDFNIFCELDGKQHNTSEGKKYDLIRTRKLKKEGYEPLRFSNRQIHTFTLEQINKCINLKIDMLKLRNSLDR